MELLRWLTRLISSPIAIASRLSGRRSIVARGALDVQHACNLGGVFKSFVAVVEATANDPESSGRVWIRQDAAVRLFADKIPDMVGRPAFDQYVKDTEECRAKSEAFKIRTAKSWRVDIDGKPDSGLRFFSRTEGEASAREHQSPCRRRVTPTQDIPTHEWDFTRQLAVQLVPAEIVARVDREGR
jgi:hypothetical protein